MSIWCGCVVRQGLIKVKHMRHRNRVQIVCLFPILLFLVLGYFRRFSSHDFYYFFIQSYNFQYHTDFILHYVTELSRIFQKIETPMFRDLISICHKFSKSCLSLACPDVMFKIISFWICRILQITFCLQRTL